VETSAPAPEPLVAPAPAQAIALTPVPASPSPHASYASQDTRAEDDALPQGAPPRSPGEALDALRATASRASEAFALPEPCPVPVDDIGAYVGRIMSHARQVASAYLESAGERAERHEAALLARASAEAGAVRSRAHQDAGIIVAQAHEDAEAIVAQARQDAEGTAARAEAQAQAHLTERLERITSLTEGLMGVGESLLAAADDPGLLAARLEAFVQELASAGERAAKRPRQRRAASPPTSPRPSSKAKAPARPRAGASAKAASAKPSRARRGQS
jgi:vacuolar-type H+-ATPase subunit H